MSTVLATHQWVRMTSEPVVAIVDPVDGTIYAEPPELGFCGEVVGCALCGETLSSATISSVCSP